MNTHAREMPLLLRHLHLSLLSSLAVAIRTPPVRRVGKPPIVPLSEHLYSYGVEKLNREVTLNGRPAVNWLCWEHIKGVPCACGGERAHLFQAHCGKDLSGQLGASAGCNLGDGCSKPHAASHEVLDALCRWHEERFGSPPSLGTMSLINSNRSEAELSRSAATAAGVATTHGIELSTCTATPGLIASRLLKHAQKSTHVQRLLEAPFLSEMLDGERSAACSRSAVP